MVLVDTTVWIDFFAGRSLAVVAELERLLAEGEDICTCGIVLTEVLQGIRDETQYRKTLKHFERFLFLPMQRATFIAAADLYRSLRRRGITIRQAADCLIAAVSLQHDVPLLHRDRDFDPLERHCGLKVVRPREAK